MPAQGDDFTYRLFYTKSIGQDWPICLMACCCPAIRWAETMSMAPLLPFWAALGLMLLLSVLQSMVVSSGLASPPLLVVGGLMPMALSVLIGVYFRQRLRKIYNHGPFTP